MSDKPIKQLLRELTEQRNREGRQRLSGVERIAELEDMYDGALYWLKACVVTASSKGTGAAVLVLTKAREEVEALQRVRSDNYSGVEIEFDMNVSPTSQPDAQA